MFFQNTFLYHQVKGLPLDEFLLVPLPHCHLALGLMLFYHKSLHLPGNLLLLAIRLNFCCINLHRQMKWLLNFLTLTWPLDGKQSYQVILNFVQICPFPRHLQVPLNSHRPERKKEVLPVILSTKLLKRSMPKLKSLSVTCLLKVSSFSETRLEASLWR